MADIQTLKDKIKSTIYPNGKGAINATDHQALLLEMVDKLASLASVSAYAECTTAAYTAAKKINLQSYNGKPVRLAIKMFHACLVENPTMSINDGQAYPLLYNWDAINKNHTWNDGDMLDVIFDGQTFYAFSIAEEIFTASYRYDIFEKGTLNASNGTLANNDNAFRTSDFISVVPGTYELELSFPKEVSWIYWLGYKDGVFVKRDVVGESANANSGTIKVDDTFNQIKITTSASSITTPDDVKNTFVNIKSVISNTLENALQMYAIRYNSMQNTLTELKETDAGLSKRVTKLEENGSSGGSGNLNTEIEGLEIGNLNATTGLPFAQNNALRTPDFISVVPGVYNLSFTWPKDVAWTYWLGYKDGVFVKRDVVGSTQNVQSAQIKVDKSFNQIKITTYASSDFTASQASAAKVTIVAPIDAVVQGLTQQIAAIKNVFEYEDKSSLFNNVGFVSTSGQISTSTAYRYTNPVKVKKGDIFVLQGISTASVAVVSECNGETVTTPLKVVVRGNNDGRQEFVYVADATRYIVFSIYNEDISLLYIKDGSLPKSMLYKTAGALSTANMQFICDTKPNLNIEENYVDLGNDPFLVNQSHIYEFKKLMTSDLYRKIYFNINTPNLQILVFSASTSSISFRNYNEHLNENDIIMGAISRGNKNGDIYSVNYHTFAFDYTINNYDTELKNVAKIANTANNICDLKHPYIYHYFMTGFDANILPTIPGQSLEDIAIAHRLGFKCIEANVHKTADGNYVVTHGNAGNLGYAFEDLNGNLVNTVAIGGKTLAELQGNYRYRSKYPQFKTRIPSLEEFLRECKRQGLAVYVQYVDDNEMKIVRNVMGAHNFIQSFGKREDGSYTAAYSDWETLRNKMLEADTNYMPMMENVFLENLIADGTLQNKIDEIHSLGRAVGYPASYTTEAIHQQTINAGMDFAVVAYQVNDFVQGNVYAIAADCGDFSSFAYTGGNVNNSVLNLTNGGTFSKLADKSYFLSKASLHIRFDGNLHIKLGEYIDDDFVSDGKTEMVFTTFFLDSIPQMLATSVGNTKIISATYNLSQC